MPEGKQKVLAFVWDFTVHPLDLHGWADGLKAALQLLAFDNDWFVKVIASDKADEIYQQVEELRPDYVLCWGSLDRPSFAGIRNVAPDAVIGLCFAGGPTTHPHTANFDVIFVENEVYEKAFADQGLNVKRAFGTNEELFQPMKLPKKWLGIYAAAFAKWKRHDLFAKALGHDGLAIGKFLEHEPECVDICVDNEVAIMPQVPYIVLPYLMNQARFAVITASSAGGGQRSVLEAMSCNVRPIVMSDSEKCAEFVLEAGYGRVVDPNPEAIKKAITEMMIEPNTNAGRQYILNKYSSKKYAEALRIGLEEAK